MSRKPEKCNFKYFEPASSRQKDIVYKMMNSDNKIVPKPKSVMNYYSANRGL